MTSKIYPTAPMCTKFATYAKQIVNIKSATEFNKIHAKSVLENYKNIVVDIIAKSPAIIEHSIEKYDTIEEVIKYTIITTTTLTLAEYYKDNDKQIQPFYENNFGEIVNTICEIVEEIAELDEIPRNSTIVINADNIINAIILGFFIISIIRKFKLEASVLAN